MKKLSVKARITIWYAALLLAMCAAVVWLLALASQRAAMAYYEETLKSAAFILKDEMEVEHGLLEIDDDLEDIPDVEAALFDTSGNLIYGKLRTDVPFAEGQVRSVSDGGHLWYVFDTLVEVEGLSSVWMRLVMSSDVSGSVRSSVIHDGLWLLPALALLALAGGHLLTAQAFAPVQRMTDVAASIARGEDLSARIALEPNAPRDELHELGDTLNGMLQRLESSFRREARFTADAAHELRTPLARMIAQGEYALSAADAQEKDEALESILHTAQGMNTLIGQLLLLARMDAGQVPLEDVCDLEAMVREIAQDMEPLLAQRDMTLQLNTVPCALRGSRAMLARVLINLLDNAAKYARDGAVVRVTLSRGAGQATLCVSDDGPGMRDTEQAFTRFWRADDARTGEGAGIGLSIVQSAARLHGGEAGVAPSAEGGTAFTVTLPIDN